jgi:hypothetical protein
MRGLKALVAILGAMLVAGVAVLAATIAVRMSRGAGEAAKPFAAPAIEIPQGARIEAMTAGPDRLILDLVLGDGSRALVVIDLASGRKLGTIPLLTVPQGG